MRRPDGLLNHNVLGEDKGPQDACGVFGVWAPGEEVAKLTFQFLVIVRTRHRCSFIKFGDSPDFSARSLYHGILQGVWGAIMPSFATAEVVHRECSSIDIYGHTAGNMIRWERGGVVIGRRAGKAVRDPSLNRLIGNHYYLGTLLRIETRRDSFERSDSYIARVGRHYIRLVFTETMFETDNGFVWNIQISFDLGEALVIDVIDRPAVPAGPRYCELL